MSQTTRRVGWLCSYTPVELIMAAGFTPVRITGHDEAPQAADAYMSPNMCHYVRSTIDTVVEGKHDGLAGVVFVTSCDAMRRLHDAWHAARPGMPLHVVDLPIARSAEDTAYFTHGLVKLREFLEQIAGKPITRDALASAMTRLQRARDAYRALESARIEAPAQVTASILSTMAASFLAGELPVEAWIEQVKALIEKSKITKARMTTRKDKPRIVLAGCPVHDRRFLDIVEGSGMDIVKESTCTGSTFFDVSVRADPHGTMDDLLGTLAAAYLDKPPCARMMLLDGRARALIENVKRARADGVIHYALKFCDTYQYDVPELKKRLAGAGIKVLAIEDDCTASSAGQLRTRIEAFKEMLAGGEGEPR